MKPLPLEDDRRSSLVRRTLLELAYRSSQETLNVRYPRMQVLISPCQAGMKDICLAVRRLREEKLRLRLWPEEEWFGPMPLGELVSLCGVDDMVTPAQAPKGPDYEADMVFIPGLSPGLLSRIIRLDDSHPFVRMILWALFSGKPVAALSLGTNPRHVVWMEQGMGFASSGLQAELNRQLGQLEGYGVQLLEPDQTAAWVHRVRQESRAPRPTLTAEDIYAAARLGRTVLAVPEGTLVTPLARDEARERGIRLETGISQTPRGPSS